MNINGHFEFRGNLISKKDVKPIIMKNHNPKKFALIGLPGSGKSTFASNLGKILEIPVHHLDQHNRRHSFGS